MIFVSTVTYIFKYRRLYGMLVDVQNLETGLKKFRLSKKDINMVIGIIKKQVFLYKNLKLDLSNISLAIIGKGTDELDIIRVFEHKNIPIETLDMSYEKSKKLVTLNENKVSFVFWVSFLEDGEVVEIIRGKLSDIANLSFKKVKSMTYGVTDGTEVIKIDISQQDVKGTEYSILKNAVIYAFNKQTDKKVSDLDCMAVGYC